MKNVEHIRTLRITGKKRQVCIMRVTTEPSYIVTDILKLHLFSCSKSVGGVSFFSSLFFSAKQRESREKIDGSSSCVLVLLHACSCRDSF